MIARWLELYKPRDTNVTWFQSLGFDIKTKRGTNEGEHKSDDKEKDNVKEHSLFINILSNTNPNDIQTFNFY